MFFKMYAFVQKPNQRQVITKTDNTSSPPPPPSPPVSKQWISYNLRRRTLVPFTSPKLKIKASLS